MLYISLEQKLIQYNVKYISYKANALNYAGWLTECLCIEFNYKIFLKSAGLHAGKTIPRGSFQVRAALLIYLLKNQIKDIPKDIRIFSSKIWTRQHRKSVPQVSKREGRAGYMNAQASIQRTNTTGKHTVFLCHILGTSHLLLKTCKLS